ncbi:MAG: AfsR/SARP family transcriptional regulator [Ardenticatenaceae bacterium]
MAQLKISLLGPFHVLLDGQVVTQFRSDAIRGLLAYLAMDAGTPHRREALAGFFWPDKPEASALHNLRQGLNVLRQLLGDKRAERPFLEITRKEVQFNPLTNYWLDVAQFRTQLTKVKERQGYRLWGGPYSIKRLQQAALIYRTDFLSGFSLNSTLFEEWVVANREDFHRQALEAFKILADYHERCEEYTEAQRYARRQIELEAWREEGHRQLMRAFALNGQRNAALLQYQKCSEVLGEELGVEPEEETTALYEQIKAGHLIGRVRFIASVPPQRTPFIGRKNEVEDLVMRLVDPSYRLVTLVGEGGIGKTRLAVVATQEVAAGFAEGACFVPLADVATNGNGRKKDAPHYVLATAIGNALNLTFQSRRSIESQLLAYLRPKEVLLVLDNFEHLLPGNPNSRHHHARSVKGGADLILEILQKAPQVAVLVTSRTRLNFQSEYVMQISGLPIPQVVDSQATSYSSIRLFCERASRTWQEFDLDERNLADVIRLCGLVQGNPLAIELAAAWVEHFSVAEMVQAIQEDLDFLAATRQDIPSRHRSMRVVFEQSWRLLTEEEQHTFRKLSIFQGGFDRKAARQVANTSLSCLSSLMNKSLIQRRSTDRYHIHARLRQYGSEKLAQVAAEEQETRHRHGIYFATWLHQQEPALRKGQTLSKISQEIENVRLAWQWAVEQANIEALSQSLESLFFFYKIRSWFQEGSVALAEAVASIPPGESTRLYHKLVARQAVFCHDLGRYDEAKEFLQKSLSAVSTLGDQYERAFCLTHLARVAISQGDYASAKEHLSQAITLARQVPSSQATRAACLTLEADSLRELGIVCWNQGDYAGAKRYYEQARRIYQNSRVADQNGQAWALNKLGFVSWSQGDYKQAKRYYEQALRLFSSVGNQRGEGSTTNALGMVFERQGDYAGAKGNYLDARQIFHELGDQRGEGDALINLGIVAHHQGDYLSSQRYLEQALDIFHLLGHQRGEGLALSFLSLVSHQMESHHFSQKYAQEALQIAQDTGDRTIEGYALTYLAHALMAQGKLAQAANFYQQATTLRQQLGKPNLAMEPLAGLARVSLAQKEFPQALAQVEKILQHLEKHSLEGAVEPFRVYLTCIRVLQAHQEAPAAQRANDMLHNAYHLLQTRAAKINNQNMQRSFLHHVAAHREIIHQFNQSVDPALT